MGCLLETEFYIEMPITSIPKGPFTQTVIFMPLRVAQHRTTKLESILNVCCTASHDTARQDFIARVSRPQKKSDRRSRNRLSADGADSSYGD
jgi:hypothetical protein